MGDEQAEQHDPGPMETATLRALAEARLGPVDLAAAGLALTVARDVDLGADLAKIGPVLLRVLDALQMTPKARAQAQRGGAPGEPAASRSPLDELRERRARKHSAADMDSAAP